MKKISLFLITFSLIFAILFVAVLVWFGYFSTVPVQEKPVGPYTIVYKVHIGAPAGVGTVLEEITQSLHNEFNVTSLVKFGLYYDDVKTTPPEKCRTLVGCIIENEHEGNLHSIADKYAVAILPRGMAVVADYPYKNKLSVLFGMLKGYPALFAYAEENHILRKPVLELYDTSRGRIRYVLSTDLGSEFFDSYLLLK